MVFGRPKKVGMKRAKKKKVPARESAPDNDDSMDIEEDEVRPPSPAPGPRRAAPSPGSVKRNAAKKECDELLVELEAYKELDADAAKELTMQKHLYKAKMQRIDKAQAGKRHGSPFAELERIYKAELELSQAKLKREVSESSVNNAEANWLAQVCEVLRLENAKLRRVMRENGVRAP